MKPAKRGRQAGGPPTADLGLLAGPLDEISKDHLRERQICAMIDGLALSTAPDHPTGASVQRFLNEELTLHIRDQVEDLSPILVRRCMDADGIERTLARVGAAQTEAARLLPQVRAAVAGCLDTASGLSGEDRATLSRFAGHVRRHLVAENAILLPIAHARLTRSDRNALTAQMQLRRGFPSMREAADAG